MPDNILQFQSTSGFSGANLFVSGGATLNSTLQVNGGTTLAGRVDVGGILDVVGGTTLESTLNVVGAARFASTTATTGLASFAGGISAAGGITFGATAAFRNSILLQNSEFIRNTTDGRIDFMPAPSGTTHYGLYVDTTSWGSGPRLGTIQSSTNTTNNASILWDAPLVTANDTNFSFGSSQAYWMRMNTTGNDTLFIATPCGVNGYSSAVALMDFAAAYTNGNRSPATVHSHPNLYIYSVGAANANDFIRFEHDRTNANIVTGGTSGILIQPGSGFVGISGGISFSDGSVQVTKTPDFLLFGQGII